MNREVAFGTQERLDMGNFVWRDVETFERQGFINPERTAKEVSRLNGKRILPKGS
jgi:hypothetical protein